MSSRLLSAAVMALLMASGSALACPNAKTKSTDGSSTTTSAQQRGG